MFVRRIHADKNKRKANYNDLASAKDQKFLAKLQASVDVRKKAEQMKAKDRVMRQKHLIKKLEAQRKERLLRVGGEVGLRKIEEGVLKPPVAHLKQSMQVRGHVQRPPLPGGIRR